MDNQEKGLIRLPEVLGLLGVSRSHFYLHRAKGIYPQGFLLSPQVRVWRKSSIFELIDELEKQGVSNEK